MSELRKSSAGRFSGALWGILVAASGALMIASFSGFEVDVELAVILALCGLGLWLLLTALFASGSKSRGAQRISEPSPIDDDASEDVDDEPAKIDTEEPEETRSI